MSAALYEPDLDDAPFDDDRQLVDVVPVELRVEHLRRNANARQFQLQPGDDVIVDAEFGPALAEVKGPIERRMVDGGELPRILRKANETDLERADEHRRRESEAYRFALERIRDRELSMKLIRTQWIHDESRLVFFFSADGRVDFRALVRDLAGEFKTRIEMRQIGVRDGAQLMGGIGPCGRELCCSSFLENFEPISIRIAREQGLTLNPEKITGMCGRLMCCLVYEQKIYRRIESRLPTAGERVDTEDGPGEVRDVDVITQKVTVELDDDRTKTFPLRDIAPGDERVDDTVDDAASPTGDKLWDGDPPRKRNDDG